MWLLHTWTGHAPRMNDGHMSYNVRDYLEGFCEHVDKIDLGRVLASTSARHCDDINHSEIKLLWSKQLTLAFAIEIIFD